MVVAAVCRRIEMGHLDARLWRARTTIVTGSTTHTKDDPGTAAAVDNYLRLRAAGGGSAASWTRWAGSRTVPVGDFSASIRRRRGHCASVECLGSTCVA
jgi:hypothetical protein